MNNKKKSLPSKRIGKSRRNLRWIRGRRELRHPFSKVVLRDNHLLENLEKMKWVDKCQDKHLWSVGVVKKNIGIDISPMEMIK
jgi:hypothetical protein